MSADNYPHTRVIVCIFQVMKTQLFSIFYYFPFSVPVSQRSPDFVPGGKAQHEYGVDNPDGLLDRRACVPANAEDMYQHCEDNNEGKKPMKDIPVLVLDFQSLTPEGGAYQ